MQDMRYISKVNNNMLKSNVSYYSMRILNYSRGMAKDRVQISLGGDSTASGNEI